MHPDKEEILYAALVIIRLFGGRYSRYRRSAFPLETAS
jgi:hypothetical protein